MKLKRFPSFDRQRMRLGLVLALAAMILFGRATGFAFINYDDQEYVTKNVHVQQGLSLQSLKWAFTTFEGANWHPLAWLSLQADYQVYKLHAGGYHLTNLLLHCANVVLLFWVLSSLTGSIGRSAMVAALFGIHPLHVESVAWVSERKDVLSMFFGLLALWAYLGYVERPGIWRYLLVFLALTLGLLAKPMLVTFPFLLLLIDYWPLQRFPSRLRISLERPAHALVPQPASVRRLLLEKIPLFALVMLFCVITLRAQAGAIQTLAATSVPTRLANAVLAYARYLWQMVWPFDLAVYYPYQKVSWADGRVLVAVLLLVGLTAWFLRRGSREPYLAVGWLWYLGTLVPVIGLVQVGSQARADRYTYLPLIGAFLVVVWWAGDRMIRWGISLRVRAGVAACVLVGCAAITWIQLSYWRDSVALWEHTLAVAGPSFVAHHNLGLAYVEKGKEAAALPHLRASVELDPKSAGARHNLGVALAHLGRPSEAIAELSATLRLNPAHKPSHTALASVLAYEGRLDEALGHFVEAESGNPEALPARFHLGRELWRLQRVEAAEEQFSQVVETFPELAAGHFYLGLCLARLGRSAEAAACYSKALHLDDARRRSPEQEADMNANPVSKR
jgi:tetratricopeptide (TPR) repeat protein